MQKLQDFKTILAAIHLLFKSVINLKILENSQEYVYSEVICSYEVLVKLTVKCQVINVEFLSRDLPLNNSAIMVEWKCLKLLYSSKAMCSIDSQLKKLKRLKYLTLETLYTFSSIFSWYFIVLHIRNFLSPMFSGINNHNLSFFGFTDLSFFVFVFTTLKKKFIVEYF